MGRFDGKVALVTGGGTGIGRATSLMLAAEGAAVAVNYSRSREDAERTVADAQAHGVRAVACQADVADEPAVNRMVDAVVDELGGLDFLINNAGTTRPVPLADVDAITPEDFQRIYAVNVNGVFWCSRAAIRHMRSAHAATAPAAGTLSRSHRWPDSPGRAARWCTAPARPRRSRSRAAWRPVRRRTSR